MSSNDKTLPLDHTASLRTAELCRNLQSQMPGTQDRLTLILFDVAARASFNFCSPETEVLRLLSEDQITLNKAREWLSEWIIQGIRGPLPSPPTNGDTP